MPEQTILNSDEAYMSMAIELAQAAFRLGDVPVGAVLVDARGEVIARAFNNKEALQDPTAHAELTAIVQGAKACGSWRLNDCLLYVTKEPCVMCAGAILACRLKRLVYGCNDPKGGAVNSLYCLLHDDRLNHQVEVTAGVLQQQCAGLLRAFFANLRQKKS
ncbi:tRNA-specific adenosine-34 deaminase [Candidatus Magnetobacterium bavaricum]|uniref:tRNA-specific adenosine deaminase n=1 Tax=Candidatus Magnetobacterium bavaricum TaxID=29290 RepID=A0A0F3GM42_9BACT|nr:tRNA-specific adenosine-34 deaminase [Candidatus Magnetobacterium bavaricum]